MTAAALSSEKSSWMDVRAAATEELMRSYVAQLFDEPQALAPHVAAPRVLRLLHDGPVERAQALAPDRRHGDDRAALC